MHLDPGDQGQAQSECLFHSGQLKHGVHYAQLLLLQLRRADELPKYELFERAADFGGFEVVGCHPEALHLHFEHFVDAEHLDELVFHEELDELLLGDSDGLGARLGDEAEVVSQPAGIEASAAEGVVPLVDEPELVEGECEVEFIEVFGVEAVEEVAQYPGEENRVVFVL